MTVSDQFPGLRYINLESYERNWELRQTPVQSIEIGGLMCLRTDPKAWKFKRIRRNPHVRIVPSDRSGRPIGSWVEGEAYILEDGETKDRIQNLFKKEYGAVGNLTINFALGLRGERLTAVISAKPELRSVTS